ncbi:MAG: DNA repair protein [Oscillospiraceae bacterium]|nr:DNA repair protein [Oscillospiraceae bacterium]
MTDKQLRKLRRAELLEMMFYIQKELDELKEENESLKQKLEKAEGGLSEESLRQIVDAVKTAVADIAAEKPDVQSDAVRKPQHEQ